jgi:hypothetical protein
VISRVVNILIASIVFVFGAWVLYIAGSIRLGSVVGVVGPKFFPQLLAVIIMSMGALLGIGTLAHWRHGTSESVMTKPTVDAVSKSFLSNPAVRVIMLLCLLNGYVFALDLLGYRISSIFFIGLLLLFKGMRSPVWISAVSVALVLALYLLFHVLLSIPLPVGSLTDLR